MIGSRRPWLLLAIGRHGAHIAFLVCALVIEVTTFLTTTFLIDRDRPAVPKLDEAPATSSFPSGHLAASLILYIGIALITTSLVHRKVVRVFVWTVGIVLPVCVGLSRLYRGMHHPTDLVGSMILAAGCIAVALLATRTGLAVASTGAAVRTSRPTPAVRPSRRSSRHPMTSVGVVAHSKKRLGAGLAELRRTLTGLMTDVGGGSEEQVRPRPRRGPPRSRSRPPLHLGRRWHRAAHDRCGRRRAVTLAILPAGTANLFATNIGLPDDLEECVRIGLHGARRRLDVGTMNGEHFAAMGGVGIDAMMIRDADAGLKDKFGRIAYVWTGAKNVELDAVKTTIEVDGEPWFKGKASCVLVGNVSDVFGGLSVFPEATPDDGRLDIGVVTADGAWEWARTIGRSVVGDVNASPFVRATTGGGLQHPVEEGDAVRARWWRPYEDQEAEDQGEAWGHHRSCSGGGSA